VVGWIYTLERRNLEWFSVGLELTIPDFEVENDFRRRFGD
jgi:hypothetical protein